MRTVWEKCPKCGGRLENEIPDFEPSKIWINMWCEGCDFEFVEEFIFFRNTNTLDETLDNKGNPIKNIILDIIQKT